MSTVTYKNQPAIHKTRGNIPLAGTSHIYTVDKVLWPEEVERVISTLLIYPTLHICCGKSTLGDIRLDLSMNQDGIIQPDLIDPPPDVISDAARLPFADNAFATVLIDPPYNSKFQWMHDMLSELPRVAGTRIIFQHWFHMSNTRGLYKKAHKFHNTANYIWQPKTYFGRVNVISVYDNKEEV